MLTTISNTSADLATTLLIHYSFDLSGHNASELVKRWQQQYPNDWLHLAVIEALYQGRYKAISVQQILVFWERRGQASYHFNMEFERLICSKFPESLTSQTVSALPIANKKTTSLKVTSPQLPTAKSLNDNRQTNATALQLYSREQKSSLEEAERKQENKDNKLKHLTSSAERQLAPAVNHNVTKEASLLSDTPPPSPKKITKLLPPAAIHPPIGQFTPEKSDRSESFTSKLKAMSSEQNSQTFYSKK